MTQTPAPQFHLPQRPVAQAGGGVAAQWACVLLIGVIGLQVYALFRPRAAIPQAASVQVGGTPAEDFKAIAMKLEDRNLPEAAANAWQQYVAVAPLTPLDRAKILYRVGKLKFQNEQYQQAVADLYTAEQLAGHQDAELTRQIGLQVRECLQKLGRYSELAREMAARAMPEAQGESDLAGRQVVAEIGDEKMTLPDFERMLQAEVDMAVHAQVGLSAEQADEARKQALKQFSDPKAKAAALQQMVAARVLAAEARKVKLDESKEYRDRLMAISDGLLATTLMMEEVGKRATVTPEDAERYYQANKGKFAEPAKVTLAHIVVATEQEARDVLTRAHGGEDFAELARQFSTDEKTKNNGGRLPQPLTQDAQTIPGIGKQAELSSAIWAVSAGSVLYDVYKTDAGWQVVKVLERTEGVEKTYSQVKDQVERDVQSARQREVTQQYLQELFERHQVKLYPEAFLARAKEGGSAPKDKGGEAAGKEKEGGATSQP